MYAKKILYSTLILAISAYSLGSLSCTKRVAITRPDESWWNEGNTWVRAKGFEQWLRVLEVEGDSIYCKRPTRPNSDDRRDLVVLHASAVERIEKREVDYYKLGIVYGALVGVAIIGILLNNELRFD